MAEETVSIWLGIDWADRKHRWAMRVDGQTRIMQGELEHTPEAVEEFISSLALKYPGQRIAVALEQSRGALMFMLGKYAHLVLSDSPEHSGSLSQERVSARRQERSP